MHQQMENDAPAPQEDPPMPRDDALCRQRATRATSLNGGGALRPRIGGRAIRGNPLRAKDGDPCQTSSSVTRQSERLMSSFIAAHSANPDWRIALDQCLADLGRRASAELAGYTLGWCYLTDEFADSAEALLASSSSAAGRQLGRHGRHRRVRGGHRVHR